MRQRLNEYRAIRQLDIAVFVAGRFLSFTCLTRFHHIMIPLIACTTSKRLARDMMILLGIPKMSPVWIARFRITRRAPAGAVREPSANRTFPVYWSSKTRLRPPGVRSSGKRNLI